MARYAFNKANVRKLLNKAQRRVIRLQQKSAKNAMDYLVYFGYHVHWKSGPWLSKGAGWTWFYAANWNYGLGTPDSSVISPYRPVNDPIEKHYSAEWNKKANEIKKLPETDGRSTLFVTNSVYYGRWLNDGGFLYNTYWEQNDQPNRFLELCAEYLRRNAAAALKEAKDEVK